MLPPIRYPLPTMVLLVLASLLTWKGAEWTRGWRAEMASRLHRAVEGPPVPSSNRPQVVVGPITRRALLLRDDLPATARPGGSVVETIDRRMFADVYDTWPEPGPPTHLRLGNRKPIGWVAARDALIWNTRLVVKLPAGSLEVLDAPEVSASRHVDVGAGVLPAIGWTDKAVEIALWKPDRPWAEVQSRAWVRFGGLPPGSWGVWISQVEMPILLRLALDGDPEVVRLRAVLGRLADGRSWTRADVEAARPGLPPFVLAPNPDGKAAVGRLAEANARDSADASWSGLSFRWISLGDLP